METTAVLNSKTRSGEKSNKENLLSGIAYVGRTLPMLLFDAEERYTNEKFFNQRIGESWTHISLQDFRVQVEEISIGLTRLGLGKGDRVAMYMESDYYFCLADLGCLICGLIDVPIYLTQSLENNTYILKHSEAKALFVSSLDHLQDIEEVLAETPEIQTIIVARHTPDKKLTRVPEGMRWFTMDTIRKIGREVLEKEPNASRKIAQAIEPNDLATIVYTSGTTGKPKGVMLSHENISFNALTAFAELGSYRPGAGGEVAISFLPMSHIFARTLYYGLVAHGTTTYFSTPDRLSEDLLEIRPTLFATVPRLLEKVYSRILERVTEMEGMKKKLANWSLNLAQHFELGEKGSRSFRVRHRVADTLVFKKWRAALGGRVRMVIAGGAAVNAELCNIFGAAGINVLQGYGLTETSPVIAFNRPHANRAGTVGQVLPGVEVKIAEDGEILTRGPHIMKGYYKNPDKTAEVIDADGWFHTGDVGELTDDGYLIITDRKKDLFKLSTGKYVMPQPLENRLRAHPLIEQVVVVGAGYKYCTALIFVEQGALEVFARSRNIDGSGDIASLLTHPEIVKRFQELVDVANEGMDHWSTIKRFKLLAVHLSVENNMLTPTLKVKRSVVNQTFSSEVKAMYEEVMGKEEEVKT